MGLMYQFPTQIEDLDDHIKITDNKSLVLRTYGLPYIFWGYFTGGMIILSFMLLGIYNPIKKLYITGDILNQILCISVLALTLLLPLLAIGFLFYEKVIIKQKDKLFVNQKVLGITFQNKKISLSNNDSFTLEHFCDSPNLAKINSSKELKNYENQGYFKLYVSDENEVTHLIDRSNRKNDLEKIIKLLTQY